MRDQVARAVHPLIQRLQNQVRAITIDNQAGQQIAFRKNQPAGVRIFHHPFAMHNRRRQPPQEKLFIDRLAQSG